MKLLLKTLPRLTAAIALVALSALGTAQAATHSAGQPVTKTEAEGFLKRMAQLNHDFDEKYVDLYAADANVTGHKSDSGESRTLTGAQWRQLMLFGWEKAKKRDDRFTLKKVRFEPVGARMKVLAERYVLRKCNTDPDYHLVLGRQPDGQILITEEYFDLSVPNRCR